MGIACRIDIIEYSVSDHCGGGRNSRGKGKGKKGRKVEERKRRKEGKRGKIVREKGK
jgi:hypothetical protein